MRHQGRRLQELPAPAGSMSHTSQAEPAGVRVTAQPAQVRLVPLLPVMTWAAVTVTVTEPGVRSRIASAVTVATATAGGGALGEDAAVARGLGEGGLQRGGGHRPQPGEPRGRGLPPGPGVPGGGEPSGEVAAACSRAGGNGSSEASAPAAAAVG